MGDTVGDIDGGAWMSYDDLAARLSIRPASARNLVRRKKWRRQVGNDGRTLVLVPPDQADFLGPSDAPTDRGHSGGHQALADLAVKVGALEAELAAEQRRSAELAADRDAWRDQAQALAKARKRWRLW